MSLPSILTTCNRPYGTGLGKTDSYSHSLLVGTGTGVVPILSCLEQFINNLLTLRPEEYIKRVKNHHQLVCDLTEVNQRKKMTCRSFLCGFISKRDTSLNQLHLENTFLDMKEMIRVAHFVLYRFVPLLLLPPFGLLIAGLTFAWKSIPIEPSNIRVGILSYGTILFHLLFFILSIAIQDTNSLLNFIDLAIVIISAVSDSYWSYKELWGKFSSEQLAYHTIMMVYMIARSWSSVLNYSIGPNPIKHSNKRRYDLVVLENLRFIWIVRDASSISQIFPKLEKHWNELCDAWGTDLAREFCDITVYCTCKDEQSRVNLEREFRTFSLYNEGALQFERPSIQDAITQQSLKRVNDQSLKASRTLFVFCGSSNLASTIKQHKLLNDVALLMTDNLDHQVDLVVENYHGYFPSKKKGGKPNLNEANSLKFSVSPSSTADFDFDAGATFDDNEI